MSGALLAASAAEYTAERAVTAATPDAVTFGYVVSEYGSIDNGNFTDASGNARTITQANTDGTFRLFLSGVNVPNTGATFTGLLVEHDGGLAYLSRAAATYDNDDGGDSSWAWASFPSTWTPTEVYRLAIVL